MKFLYDKPGILLSLTALFWAANFVLGRGVAGFIPPVALANLRWLLAFLFFLPFALPYLKKDAPALIRNWRILAFLGILGPGSFNTLSYIGLVSTEAINGLALNAAGPIFIALAARLIFGDRLTLVQLLGLLLGFFGMMLIVTKGDLAALSHLAFNQGDLILVVAMVIWSVYTVFLRMRPAISWQSFNAVTYGVAAFGNLPFSAIEHAQGAQISGNWQTVASILYVAIFPSLLAYIFYNRGVELLGPARASIYMFLVPVFGALLATLFLGEQLYLFHAVGFALIAAGVTFGNRSGA